MHFGWHNEHATVVELGEEPALLLGDDKNLPPNHQRVSLRWLTGTVLTGMTSIFLMGGALFVALDGRHTFAAPPKAYAAREPMQASLTGLSGPVAKGDRIKPAVAEVSNRQIMTVSTVTRVGDRDFIKDRPFVHVTASLALRKDTEVETDIPPFNPIKIFADTDLFPDRPATDSIYGAEVDGEVSISVRDFPLDNPLIGQEGPNEREIEASVRASANFLTEGNTQIASAQPFIHPDRFDFDLASQPDLSRLAVRIIPENVSFIAKNEETATANSGGLEDRIVFPTDKQTLADLLEASGATKDEVTEISAVFEKAYGLHELPDDARVRFGIDAAENDEDRAIPARISLYSGTQHIATVARSDDGFYVPAEEPPVIVAETEAEAPQPVYSGPTLSLYESLYQTAAEQQIPERLVKELIRIYSFDVDFNSRVRPGDSIDILYALEDEKDMESAKEILYTAINLRDTKRHYYRFRTADDSAVDFYDETGKSAKKFLMRKPLTHGKFRSPFGARRHPVLGYVRMHNGVDWAAPRGTPIMASGNGVIEEAKWKSGYGRWIKIRHANGYETGYGHQSGFAKGIEAGVKVRQGQIIGYVGSTGLSTGPHVHYEVIVNGRNVDPMRIRLPRGRVLKDDALAAFQRERRHIDSLVNKGASSTKVASTQ